MFGSTAPNQRHRLLALRQLTALGKARRLLPGDDVIEREYQRLEDIVRATGREDRDASRPG